MDDSYLDMRIFKNDDIYINMTPPSPTEVKNKTTQTEDYFDCKFDKSCQTIMASEDENNDPFHFLMNTLIFIISIFILVFSISYVFVNCN